jgi:methylenetetrahydrofolate--tRNA-(uracil-5-)-methyltransferase
LHVAAQALGKTLEAVPRQTALGSLVNYITNAAAKNFQPANITFDLLPQLDDETRRRIRDKKQRRALVCQQALGSFDAWWTAAAAVLQVTVSA